jgi:hypothetical protein
MAADRSCRVLAVTTFCNRASTAGSARPQTLADPGVLAACDPQRSSSSLPGAVLPGRRADVISKSKASIRCLESEKSTVRKTSWMPSFSSDFWNGPTTRMSEGWSFRYSMTNGSPAALRKAPSRQVQPASLSSCCASRRFWRRLRGGAVDGDGSRNAKTSGRSLSRRGSSNASSSGLGVPSAWNSLLGK